MKRTIPSILMFFISILFIAHVTNAEEKVYQVGGKGPAGGWIFYDKGNSDGGWRYLEAAHEDQSEKEYFNRSFNKLSFKTDTAVGTGKSNSKKIENDKDENGLILIKVCSGYRGGGKNDWFLPSKDELNLMYINLFKKGLGNFVVNHYWSSSACDEYFLWSQGFFSGDQIDNDNFRCSTGVRAIRAF